MLRRPLHKFFNLEEIEETSNLADMALPATASVAEKLGVCAWALLALSVCVAVPRCVFVCASVCVSVRVSPCARGSAALFVTVTL